jgi:hypothetical protein
MDFYILPGKIATLFIGITMNLIINFQEPMELSGARENLLNVREVNKGKTFLIMPKTKAINTNLIFYNNKNKYMFYIKYDESKSHDFVNILEGKRDSSFLLSKENSNYRLLSGAKSVLVENKYSKPIMVNGEVVKTREVFSKGIPLFVKVDGVEEIVDRRGEL